MPASTLLVAAAAVWSGAALTGAPLRIGDALGGALNTAPVAWLALGAAVRSVSPEVVATIAFLVIGGALTALGFAGYRRRDLTS